MKTIIQRFVSYVGYPLLLLLPVGAAIALMGQGHSAAIASGLPVGCAMLLILVLERAMPYTPKWYPSWRVFGLDLLHTIIAPGVLAPIVKITGFALLAQLGVAATAQLGFQLWPAQWPIAFQILLAVVIADFGAYCAHRWMHLTRVGWTIHAVHHSLTAWTVFKAVNGLLQHSNVDFRPGVLGWVLATSDVHRWHHSVHLGESNTNFGNTTMIWDQVFRTFFLPSDRKPGTDVGVADAIIPENYLMHLATPFWLGRFEEDARALVPPAQPELQGSVSPGAEG